MTKNAISDIMIRSLIDKRSVTGIICVLGVVISFTLYGITMEYVTIGGQSIPEISFIFITSTFYTITGADVVSSVSSFFSNL